MAACRRAQASPAGPVLGPSGGRKKPRPRRAQQKGAPPPRFPRLACTPLRPASPPAALSRPQQKQKQKHKPSSPNQHVERGSPKSKSKGKSKSPPGVCHPRPRSLDPVACARKKAHGGEQPQGKRKPRPGATRRATPPQYPASHSTDYHSSRFLGVHPDTELRRPSGGKIPRCPHLFWTQPIPNKIKAPPTPI